MLQALIDRKEDVNSFLFIFFLFLPIVTVPIKYLTNSGLIVWISTVLIITLSVIINKPYREFKYYIFFGTIVILFLFNLALVSYRLEAMYQITDFLKFAAVPLFLGMQDMNYNKVLKIWYYFSIITLIIYTFYINAAISDDMNYMLFGKNISIAFAGIAIQWIEKRKLFNFGLSLYAFILVFLFGNRGALITNFVLIIYIGFLIFPQKVKTFLMLSGLIFIILYYSGIFVYLIEGLENMLLSVNISSRSLQRTLNYLSLSRQSAFLSGRDWIYIEAWNLAKNANFLPMGLGYYQSKVTVIYPHNIFLDLILIFGFLSIPIIIGLVYALIKFYKNNKCSYKKELVNILVIISITRLIFSDTFISFTPFWMLMILIFDSKIEYISYKLKTKMSVIIENCKLIF